VACAFCALADTGRLDLPSLSFLLAGLSWRGLTVLGVVRFRVPQHLITVLAIAYIAFYPLDFYFISRDFFAATAHGVCFLGVARVLSARSNRDYLYTGSLAFVALMGAAALSTRIRFLGWLAGAIVCGIAALTSAEIRRGFRRNDLAAPVATASVRAVWRLGLLVGVAFGGILALTAGLFLIVPRTARAAASLFPGGPRLTGFTNSIDLGGLGSIAKDERPVLHIHSSGASLPPNLKWRGSALSQFDGRHWSEPQMRGQFQRSIEVADLRQRSRLDGARMLYRVDVGSSDTGTLFIAGIPEFIRLVPDATDTPQLMRTSGDSFRAIPALGQPLSYEVSAQNVAPLAYPLTPGERRRYLSLPAGLDPRIPQLGRDWSGAGTDSERAYRVEKRLHRDFTYSLDGTSAEAFFAGGADPLARFLFVTRRGYCEFFASAMAVILRSQGIPARVAMGFQGGYYNDVSGYLVMRASDAHAWVEAWIDGRGWVTFDPTPPGAEPAATGWLWRFNMYLDAANTTWQRWVVAYNPAQQAALAYAFQERLRSLRRGGEGPMWANAPNGTLAWLRSRGTAALALVVVFALCGIACPPLWRRWHTRERLRRIRRGDATAGDAVLLYRRMLETMARRGFQKPAWFTPAEFARNLPDRERDTIDAFTSAYNRMRFGGDPGGASRMAEMLERLESVR
jgi:transglutaminase-like putative cysteine protease